MKVAILTSKSQWFVPYARELAENLKCPLYFSHKYFVESYEIVFILSYHSIIPKEFLDTNKHNIVIHASSLPKGKGWSPMFWQVLEGKSEITFSLFEADCGIDSGDIYLQDMLRLKGGELYDELRELQARMCQKMCLEFLDKYPNIESKKQVGEESFYQKRTKDSSELDITKSLESQFNLLRIVSNEEFPAFFYKDGKKFIIKIYDSSCGS
ncbi:MULTISPECIES: formyltransferase family protein [Helicobacter]|uniref:Formyltransferase family protein n=1 Tax=Helicobacter ibis TaxID=2962633 RepID=A0ABT4VF96_9HELI|nr:MULTISPECIES: formyltransferase family protein [Helicobacter]MDA3967674.1 formyltransferase family protein [Helicobacter sp. WB40]MDA3969392.1 formyltransferase family protein [Helicobacter ibis]